MEIPVRKIGIANRSASVVVPGFGCYESALERDWDFCVFTEKEIRTLYLENARFWLRIEIAIFPQNYAKRFLTSFTIKKMLTSNFYCVALQRDKNNRPLIIPALLYLVAKEEIGMDLDKPMNMRSKVWPKECLVLRTTLSQDCSLIGKIKLL